MNNMKEISRADQEIHQASPVKLFCDFVRTITSRYVLFEVVYWVTTRYLYVVQYYGTRRSQKIPLIIFAINFNVFSIILDTSITIDISFPGKNVAVSGAKLFSVCTNIPPQKFTT